MRVNRSALLLLALLLAGAAGAQSPSPPRSAPWRPLTPPAAGDPLTITLGYLADRRGPLGLSDDDLAGWVVRSRFVTRRTGVTHLVLSQQLDGIDVFKAGVTASIDPAGRLVAFGDRLVRDLRARAASRRPVLSAAQAVASAAQQLGLAPAAGLTVRRRPGGAARAVVFAPSGLSRDEIPVRLEFVPTESEVRLAWNVVIRTPDGRHWWNLHVDTGSGALLRQDDWIDHDSYRFFAPPLANPDEGPRSLLVSPADPVASPFGWHDTDGAVGAEFSDTRGNNVFAQEDADADDLDGHRPDGGAGLDFDFPIDFAQQPSGYRDAATTNLFSWNNFLHDVMYRYGFDEPAGNFQENNYGQGGAAGDPVQADAQDGADTGNAQFGTPPDGLDPRMEMFLWEVGPIPGLEVHSPPAIAGSYPVGEARFGYGTLGLTGDVAQALDPADLAGPATTDACSPLTNAGAVAGHIALIDRGSCDFVVKVANAQAAGAIGAIIVNNEGDTLVIMRGADSSVVIPSVFVMQSAGADIEAQLASGVSATLVNPADRDAALDSGVVVHEYGHGVSNRLTGGPANVSCLDALESEGMGEGWSDWWSLVFTAANGDAPEDARPIGTYLVGESPSGPGIRNHPYSTDLGVSPLTYGDVGSLNRPHGVGEVWAASLWEMYWNLVGVYGFDPDLATGAMGNNLSLALVMDGLKLQPCDPTFVQGRDAILMADAVANAAANRCLIWAAFAKRGVGFTASAGGSPNNLNVSEAFDIPAECEPQCGDGLLQLGETCDDGNTEPDDGCSETCQIPVPEPGSTAMLIAGIVFLLTWGRRRSVPARAL